MVAQTVKNLPAMWETLGLTPGSGRSPGGGHGNPLQYSCLENLHGQSGWWAIVRGQRIGHDWAQRTHHSLLTTRGYIWLYSGRVTPRRNKQNEHMLGREGVWELLCLADSEGVIWPLVEMTTCIYVTGNGNPLQYSCLENPMDRGAWRVHGVTRVGHDLVTKPPQGGSSTDKTEVHVISVCIRTCSLNWPAPATISTMMLPTATVNSHPAWSTDFMLEGAWREWDRVSPNLDAKLRAGDHA